MKLFAKIQELIEDPETLVCVLIDEVESLTSARKASGSEPSDAIRAVNALLTQIDKLKRYPNVIILTTSNITQAIDLAFVDRADIKQYIGLPTLQARYEILRSCLHELMRVNIIQPAIAIPNFLLVSDQKMETDGQHNSSDFKHVALSLGCQLHQIALDGSCMSGRTLRKLPFQAHAFFLQSASAADTASFIDALRLAADLDRQSREALAVASSGSGVESTP